MQKPKIYDTLLLEESSWAGGDHLHRGDEIIYQHVRRALWVLR